jgi:hypothetical protein
MFWRRDKCLVLARILKPGSSSPQPSHYTVYTMRAPNENVDAFFNKEIFHFISQYPEHTADSTMLYEKGPSDN